MRTYLIIILILSLIMVFFPFITISDIPDATQSTLNSITQAPASKIESTTQSLVSSNSSPIVSREKIEVVSASTGKIIEVEIYDFLEGTLSAEMPASYEKEALKAQCVALYSYAKWIKKNSDSGKLTSAEKAVMANISKSYLDGDQLKAKWGKLYESYKSKIDGVINSVLGEYLIYENEPIIAAFHELSTGKTESAKNVWGNDIAYLQSVSANGDILAPNYESTVTLSKSEFKKIVEKIDNVSLTKGNENKWIGKMKHTQTGYVKTINIGEKDIDGRDAAIMFSLNSPYFTVEYHNEQFFFSVKGIGDGVGMSQYSADYMARQGSDYKEILSHFYKGTELVKD